MQRRCEPYRVRQGRKSHSDWVWSSAMRVATLWMADNPGVPVFMSHGGVTRHIRPDLPTEKIIL